MGLIGKGFDVPPEDDCIGDFRWWKLGANKVLRLVIMSQEATYYFGHFYAKRMQPCTGDGCAMCKAGIGRQLRFVLAAAEATTKAVGLIEVGRSVGLEINDLIGRHGTLRGMQIELSRLSWSRQSRMEVEYVDRETPGWLFELATPNISKALEATWKRAGGGPEIPDEPAGPAKHRPWPKKEQG